MVRPALSTVVEGSWPRVMRDELGNLSVIAFGRALTLVRRETIVRNEVVGNIVGWRESVEWRISAFGDVYFGRL